MPAHREPPSVIVEPGIQVEIEIQIEIEIEIGIGIGIGSEIAIALKPRLQKCLMVKHYQQSPPDQVQPCYQKK